MESFNENNHSNLNQITRNHNIASESSDLFVHYLQLLIITLWKGGYPHEILSCLCEKLDWKPKMIVKQLADIQLFELYDMIIETYSITSDLPKDVLYVLFESILMPKLLKIVKHILKPKDQQAKVRWKNILFLPVGNTCLNDYFTKDPENNISNWTSNAHKNVKRALEKDQWLKRPYEDLLLSLLHSTP